MALTKKARKRSATALVRPLVQHLHAYVPGEQPKIAGLIKLNTNENPYPPAPKVLRAVCQAVDGRLRLYPNPTAEGLRRKLAAYHRCEPENIIVGNGSDELLAMAVRCFVEPVVSGGTRRASAANLVQFFTPSYSLYPVLGAIHGAETNPVPLREDFSLPDLDRAGERAGRSGRGQWKSDAALSFITTPNAPSGTGYPGAQLERLCRRQKGVVVLDEAYVDFAAENALELGLKFPHVLVARTFSKAYSLCFQRVGYFVGHPELIEGLQKIRDSYNVNGLGQVAAEATLDALPYYRKNFRRIIASRRRLSRELGRLDFEVLPSQTNFILARPPRMPAREWLEELRARRILVRWFDQPGISDYLRITIGTEEEIERLLEAVRDISPRSRA